MNVARRAPVPLAARARPIRSLSYGAFVPILLLGHSRFRPHSLGGLYEKLFLAVELAWFLVAAAWIASLEGGSTA